MKLSAHNRFFTTRCFSGLPFASGNLHREQNHSKFIRSIGFIAVILFASCIQRSVLSDVEITDPSVIKANIKLEKDIAINGNIINNIEALLYDRNENFIELKNGGIFINGISMDVEYITFSDWPYYFATDKIDLLPDSLYQFTIMLSDSSKWVSSIRTQQKNIYLFNVPLTASRHDSIKISWLEKDTTGNMSLSFKETLKIDSATYQSKFFNLNIDNPAAGEFTFPPDYFDSRASSVDITLFSERYGQINNSLKSGSYIKSTISIQKSMEILQ